LPCGGRRTGEIRSSGPRCTAAAPVVHMKKRKLWLFLIIASIPLLAAPALFIYIVHFTFSSPYFNAGPCGMDDGPFIARRIEPAAVSAGAQTFPLSGRSQLVVDNRPDGLPPLVALIEDGETKWTLEMDVSRGEEYKDYRLWEINGVTIGENNGRLQLSFLADWSFGMERGSMEIDRQTGANWFCLSW